jgi:hypothetical protein
MLLTRRMFISAILANIDLSVVQLTLDALSSSVAALPEYSHKSNARRCEKSEGLIVEVSRFERHHVSDDDTAQVVQQVQGIDSREINQRRGAR